MRGSAQTDQGERGIVTPTVLDCERKPATSPRSTFFADLRCSSDRAQGGGVKKLG